MKKKIFARILIMMLILVIVAAAIFAEIGVATTFNMTFKGLSYIDYVREFYAVPWHLILGIVMMSGLVIWSTEMVYKATMENN